MLVVLLGPDGSGKTTLSLAIQNYYRDRGGRVVQLFAQRFGFFPTLKDLLRLKFRSEIDVSDLQEKEVDIIPNSKIRSYVHLFYYSLEYLLARVVFRKEFSSDGLIMIFARYFYDFYFQSNHKNINHRILNVIQRLIPKPDLVFFLDRDSSVIFNSKPELPIFEIERQKGVINDIPFRRVPVYRLNCNVSVEESLREAIGVIDLRMEKIKFSTGKSEYV